MLLKILFSETHFPLFFSLHRRALLPAVNVFNVLHMEQRSSRIVDASGRMKKYAAVNRRSDYCMFLRRYYRAQPIS